MRLECKKKWALEFPVIIKEFKVKHKWGKPAIRNGAVTGLKTVSHPALVARRRTPALQMTQS